MPKIKFKFEGTIEVESSDVLNLKKNQKYRVNAILGPESIEITEIKPEIAHDPPEEKEVKEEQKDESTVVVPINEEKVTEEIEMDKPWSSEYVSLEQYGGEGYYKLIEGGLKYEGNKVKSNQPVFSPEDEGKSFCGLFAHKNPNTPSKDEYYPGIIGSRYSIITSYISPNEIEVNFNYNHQSDKGYVFFDNTMAFKLAVDATKRSASKVLELQDGKTYVVPQYEKADVRSDFYLIAKNEANLKIGWEDFFQWSDIHTIKQSAHLFEVGGNSLDFGIRNVNFLPPHRRVSGAQLFFASLFKGQPNPDQQLNIVVENMDTTKEVNEKDARYNQFGFGYGFLYSSEKGNYVIGKNLKHRGPGFMDFKANFGGGLYAVFENVETNFKDENKFASTKVKVKGKLENNVFTITSDNTVFQIYSYDFGRGNVAHILHFDRFTFMIDGKDAILNANQFKVRPFAKGKIKLKVKNNQFVYAKEVELHAGDTLTYNGVTYKIIEKTRTYVTEWMEGDENTQYAMGLKLDKPMPVDSGIVEFDVNSIGERLDNGQEVEAYLIYKANYEFRSYENTKFEDREILDSTPVGHLSYNHKEITLWAKNFKHNGFYRQSLSHVGKSNGYTLIDCEGFGGQFSPEIEVKKEGVLPKKAEELIRNLEKK